ncbi:MAG: cytochrome c-type biogenesis CcmF C-terminal domain-containing protein, partial [Stenotrophomonas sp.]
RPTPDSVARLAHRLTAGRRGVAEDPLYAALRSVLPELSLDALGEPLGNNAWAVRVHVKPFVRWIWLGALLMALGGFVTAADRRFRRP